VNGYIFSKPLTHSITSSFFIATISLSSFVTAATSSNLSSQQKLYNQAITAFDKKDTKTADKLTNRLKNYSLYPYLQLKQIRRDIYKTSEKDVFNFIDSYVNTPLAKKAQSSYLQKLARQKKWKTYISAYKKLPLTSAHYQCYLLQAQINTGKGKQVLAEISDVWNVSYSQPKSCDPVFAYWQKNGKLTSNIAFDRTWKAINKKNYALAKHLQKKVTKKNQLASLDLFWTLQKDVSSISDKKTLSKKTLHNADLAAYAIRKLAIKKGTLALNTWLRDRDRFNFSDEQKKYLNVYFGNKFAKGTYYNPKALAILQKIDPAYQYDEVSEWKVRQALISQDWKNVVKLIKSMPQSLQQENRWIYWLETAKQRSNPKQYKANYANIINERDFYSFIAAHLTGEPLQLNDKTTKINKAIQNGLLKMSSVQRMAEFVKLGHTSSAYQEWNLLRNKLTKEQNIAMGYIASQWGWHIQGIRIAAKFKVWDELGMRFPRSQNKLFAKLGNDRKIGETWPVAIARQESAYNRYAKSSAGARGFMQLMPATAKQTAKKFDIDYSNKNDLFDPTTNISLGTAYLSEMLGKFGSKAYASAGYNAGPHRVERWLKSRGKLPLDIWIETIPFNETRGYVQNVLTYSAIYDLLEGKKAVMFNKKDTAKLTLNQS